MEDWSLPVADSIQVNVSGHDAASLGGLPPSFYLNAANLTGTIDVARIPNLDWAIIATGKPTTLSGYGIGDAVDVPSAQSITGSKTFSNITVGRFTANSPAISYDVFAGGIYDFQGSLHITGIPPANNQPRAIVLNGNVTISSTAISTSTTTGAITVPGGQGIQGNQYVGGFSSLGGDTSHPAIKIKVLSGTTASTQGGSTDIDHGLTLSKIVSVSVIVDYLGTYLIPMGHTVSSGFFFDCSVSSNALTIFLSSANSANILSKPFKATIIYTQ